MVRTANGHLALISAHQGGSENGSSGTWEAYRSARDTGAEYVEFDIRITADDVHVVYHGERVTLLGSPVSELTYNQLCDEAGYSVPTVPDVMEMVASTAIGHLDLKEVGREREVIEMALDVFGPDRFIATSLEDESIATIKRDFPYVRTALSLGGVRMGQSRLATVRTRISELHPLSRVRACGADWVSVNCNLARFGVLRLCKRNGIGAMVWTVNKDRPIKRLLMDDRVDVLVTDRPDRAVAIRSALSFRL